MKEYIWSEYNKNILVGEEQKFLIVIIFCFLYYYYILKENSFKGLFSHRYFIGIQLLDKLNILDCDANNELSIYD